MDTIAELWRLVDEPIGVAIGLIIVWCLIKENLWAWPLGVAYVGLLALPLWEAQLYSNLMLHVLGFLPLNLYGWYYWVFGGEQRRALPVTRSGWPLAGALLLLCSLGTLVLGAYFDRRTDAAFPYWDNAVTVMSLAAMWLTARKKIENWIVWFVVDVISVALYSLQELYLLAGLYLIYLAMAVLGYREWLQSMRAFGDLLRRT
jgi:nicotinamide mononucleotide transporter